MKYNYWYEFSKINFITPYKKWLLINHFKTPYEFYEHNDYYIKKTGLLTNNQLYKIRSISYTENIDEKLRTENISLLTYLDKKYPSQLLQIYDPPICLFIKGDISLLSKNIVAVVGSRLASEYGQLMCRKFTRCLINEGYITISGMATGIDTCCHKYSQNKTIAVLGFGFDYCYPYENKQLYYQLQKNALVISEYPPDIKPNKYHFPARNRIISGLSIATIIVQAGKRSGTLITAEYTIENNRELFVIPHNLNSNSIGCNELIRDGASIIIDESTFLEQIKKVEIY
ncbi:MAG: DNA-processing protein DprA [Clostridiales bacterium]|nr:DNA-processing protein DprA [Clostridiales bacterium]